MDFPLVVKPVDNMGARGCRMVRSEEEFKSAVDIAVSCSRSGYAIIEEYMEGPEYSIDALVYNGTFTVTGFAIRHIKYPPYFIEIGHTMPAVLEKSVHDQLISVFALGAKALGLSCGAAKADIKFTKKGPMIGEIAGRLSGGYMSGWTYPYASDLNLTKQGLLIACGREPEDLIKNRKPVDFEKSQLCMDAEKPYELFEVPCKRTSAERAWMSIPGTVEYIENINEYTDKAIFDFLPRATVKLGGKVDFPRNNVEKCGNIIAVSHNEKVAVSAAQDAVSNVFITLKANTKIEMHPDRIIISSPGGLVADMSKEDYINGNYSYLRNPIIANVFRRLNIIEAFATGIKRINEAYKDAIVKPIYDVTSSAISVTLPIIDQASLSLNEKKVYDAMKQNYSYSRLELEEISGFAKDTLIRILNSLVEKGIVEKSGKARATTYVKK